MMFAERFEACGLNVRCKVLHLLKMKPLNVSKKSKRTT